jgi:uncharacterized damage-inducible protein DinB
MLYNSLKERLLNQHSGIYEIIKNADDAKMLYNPEHGKWNIHDNIAHLAIYQPIFINRIHKILKEDNPAFNAYRADDDPDFIVAKQLSLNELLDKLESDREEIYFFIITLSHEQLTRTGTHPKYGKLTVADWVEFFLLHEAHHLFTIFKLAKG